MVGSSHVLTDGGLHQTRQRRQHVDRRVDQPVVQLAIDVDLALGNVARQVGNRVSNIVVGHGQNGNLSDRATASAHTTGALVDRRQIGVHVAGVTAATGHSSRAADTYAAAKLESGMLQKDAAHLTQGIGVRRHVCEDDQHVLLALVGKVLGGGERQTRGDDALNGGVVG